MNTTFLSLEIRRVLRDPASVFFIAVLPSFFFVIFGAASGYAEDPIGNGNASMYVMIGMAAYGAATATAAIGGRAAVERLQGWGRQLGLTPLSDGSFVAVKVALAMAIALLPIGLTFLLGAATKARADWWVWAISASALIAGSLVWALYGLCAGLLFRSEAAVGAANGVLVVLSFLGNIFVPLSGTMLTIAKFTPLYGYVALARYPLTEGIGVTGASEPLWVAVTNVLAWTTILTLVAVRLVSRGRSRQ